MSKTEKKEAILEKMANEDLQMLILAYMYAKNMHMYGEDVTRKFLTATENTAMLDKAYQRGYYDAMEKAYKDTDTEHLKVNIAYSLNEIIHYGPSDDEVRWELSKRLADAIINKIIIKKEEIAKDNDFLAIKYSTDIFIKF